MRCLYLLMPLMLFEPFIPFISDDRLYRTTARVVPTFHVGVDRGRWANESAVSAIMHMNTLIQQPYGSQPCHAEPQRSMYELLTS